ncbi:hypothetical protein CHELA40_11215 [Chelatococcus asaccharovorans]|nr:hypothetical protein CHELA40_11215 [Chelatococcus asaccharovorans]
MVRVQAGRGGMDRSGSADEDAPFPSGAVAQAGGCHSQERAATHRPWHPCLSLDPLGSLSHVGKHIECGATSFGLHQGRDDLARVPRECQFHAQRERLMASRAIERQLAHVEENSVRRAYARGEHWDERVRMMTWWADRLDELRECDLK